MNSQVPEVEVDESAVRFSDGLVISLSDIKEVKAPKVVLGAANHPLTIAIASCLEQGQGVVYLLYATRQGPASKVIPTADFEAASSLAKTLQEAAAAAKRKQATSERVVVGECIRCHRPLRARAHAVRPGMTLTCKCGQENKLSAAGDGSVE